MSKTELFIPHQEFEVGRMSDADMAKHEEFAGITLDQFIDDMPNPRTVITIRNTNSFDLRAVDLRASDEGSSNKAVVLPLPWGNGYSPSMYIRARAVQAFLPEATRLVMFPNNVRGEEYYSFDDHKQSDGVELLGHHILTACRVMGIEEVAIAGYSQGASVGASIMKEADRYGVDVKTAFLGDPPDTVDRTPKELKKAFMGSGLGKLNQAINESGISALSQAQLSRGGLDTPRQLLRFAGVGLNSRIPENRRLHESMANDRFVGNIVEALDGSFGDEPEKALVVARMALSKVCTVDLKTTMIDAGLVSRLQSVDYYGHEGGDNVVDFALRFRDAVADSKLYTA